MIEGLRGKAYFDPVVGPLLPWPCVSSGGGDVRHRKGPL